ncbi:MAG: hypothetical protein HYZ43_03505 [Flavobacteriia bacterium]|nr:hypothetical protein [Flavobacteriia bacterium]
MFPITATTTIPTTTIIRSIINGVFSSMMLPDFGSWKRLLVEVVNGDSGGLNRSNERLNGMNSYLN